MGARRGDRCSETGNRGPMVMSFTRVVERRLMHQRLHAHDHYNPEQAVIQLSPLFLERE
jgi:hypothetical protein